jgi:hypothetical protein
MKELIRNLYLNIYSAYYNTFVYFLIVGVKVFLGL